MELCRILHVCIHSYQLLYTLLTSVFVNISSLVSVHCGSLIHARRREIALFFFATDGHQSLTFAL